jgi:uncharacterized membrane protein
MNDLQFALTLVAALGAGVVGGVFYAFSTFVMPALRRVPSAPGIVAMQSINRLAPTAPFMLAFLGTAAVSAAVVVVALFRLSESGSALAMVGAAVYLVLVLGLTAGYHVPRNNALDAVDADDPTSEGVWRRYLREWVPANHVRTVAGIAAAAVLACSLLQQ